MAPATVVCCGLTTLDLTYEGALVVGTKTEVPDYHWDVGGPAANAARTAALLGSRVLLHTLLGRGPFAAAAREVLAGDGVTVVDHTPVTSSWQVPVSTAVVAPDGERTVISGNASGAPAATGPVPDDDAAVILVDGHHPDLAAAVLAGAGRAVVVLDGGSWKPGLAAVLPHIDVAVLSADFAAPDQGLLDGVPAVAVSHGARPLDLRVGQQRLLIDVPAVAAVDTLGAGDVLHGALAHELAARPGAGVEVLPDALARAAEVASRSCAYRGVTTWARADGATR